MNKNRKVAIIGAGGQAKVIVDIFRLTGTEICGYISSEPKGTYINGYQVLCSIDEFANSNNALGIDEIIISIGDNFIRSNIVAKLSHLNIKYINAIHPRSNISSRAIIGEDVVINAGATINSHAVIGSHCNIGSNSSIDHDCCIKNYVNIAPGAILCGNVIVHEFSVIGPGAVVIEKINVGANSLIAAGSVVVNNINNNTVIMGVPGKSQGCRQKGKKYLR